jgi:hypothetical protein
LRTLLIGALATALVGCSRQPPPQAATVSCTGANGFACLDRTDAHQPIDLASFRISSAATNSKSAGACKTEKPSSAHHGVRLASKPANSAGIAARAEPPAHRIPLPPGSSKTRQLPAGSSAAAAPNTMLANIAQPHPTVVANSNTRTIEAQVAAATALAERMTVATAAPVPDMKANNSDGSSRPDTLVRGNAEKTASASINNADLLVAVLMARPEIKLVSDLTGRNIAIDERYSASNGNVRVAIVAAGAPEVQLSEGQTTALNRLINGEVPAAVLALVSADAAEGFPEIEGFKIFHIPLSPRSLKAS